MAQFHETFTKKENRKLEYDTNAFSFFFWTLGLVILLPLILTFIRNFLKWQDPFSKNSIHCDTRINIKKTRCQCTLCELSNKKKKIYYKRNIFEWCLILSQLFLIVMLSFLLIKYMFKLSQHPPFKRFDPFEILQVSPLDDIKTIRRKYRSLSLIHHPDRNPDDPMASAKIMSIYMAYKALTDETAKHNYEKYGNPDGPQFMEIGIGLPSFILNKEHKNFFLILSVFLIVWIIPFLFFLYYGKYHKYSANGIRIETIHLIGSILTKKISLKKVIMFIAGSQESRDMTLRKSDHDYIEHLNKMYSHEKPKFAQFKIVARNFLLIKAYLDDKIGDNLPLELQHELASLIKIIPLIVEYSLQICVEYNSLLLINFFLNFQKYIIHKIPYGSSELYQIPHYNNFPSSLKKKLPSTFKEIIAYLRENTELLSVMSEQERTDLVLFCKSINLLCIDTRFGVKGEDDIVYGDRVTITLKCSLKYPSKENEYRAIHAPHFPADKFEVWWFFVFVKDKLLAWKQSYVAANRMYVEMDFLVTTVGNCTLDIFCHSDSFLGLEYTIQKSITVNPAPTLSSYKKCENKTNHDESLDSFSE